MLYGRDFEDESVEILKIGDEIGDVVIRGRVQSVDMREIRNERTIFMFTITDFTDTIGVKIFVQNAEVPELKDAIKKGAFIKVKGKTTVDAFDHDLTVMSVWGIKKITDFRTGRQYTSPVKRVELHCHTKMSDMDGVTDAARLVQRAYKWGTSRHRHHGPRRGAVLPGGKPCDRGDRRRLPEKNTRQSTRMRQKMS